MLDYVSRVSQFVRFGKADTKTLVIHPYEHAVTLYQGNLLKERNKELDAYDLKFHNLIKALKSVHCDFDLGDGLAFRDMARISENNEIIIGNMSYNTVILPDISVITKQTYDILKEFSKNGGKIICFGKAPEYVNYEKTDVSSTINFTYASDISNLLPMVKESYDIFGTDMASHIIVNHRFDDKNDYFMLMNTDCSHKKKLTLALKGTKKAVLWNAEYGTQKELFVTYSEDTTKLNICIDEGASVLLSFEDGICSVKNEERASAIYLDDNWKISRENENVLYEYDIS